MDYEQKYKEALANARQEYNTTENVERKQWLEELFPELKEFDDEKIRKVLVELVKCNERCGYFMINNITTSAMLAWLEKQGEQKETLCDKCKKEQPTHSCQDITALGRCAVEHEQNHTDKVEPTFKVGEWIVYKNDICQIVKREEGCNKLVTTFGIEKELVNERNLSTARLWTIQDAKDGDVLVVPPIKGSKHSEQIFIFKEIKDREYVKNAVEYYCRCMDNEFATNERGFMGQSDDYFTPATKEQRDLLFQKMKEEGYEWDANKKELKNIGFIDEYEGLTDFERTLADICIGWIGKDIGWKEYIKDNSDTLLKIAVKKFNSVQDAPFEQKPTDEEMKELLRTEYEKGRADAIGEMQKPVDCTDCTNSKGCINCKNGNMKETLVQKSAWSEDDETYLNTTVAYLKDAKEFKKTAENCISWLKSLKDRVQPKHILHRTHTIFDQII